MNLERIFENEYINKLKECKYVGAEIEMPLVNLGGNHIVDPQIVQIIFEKLKDINFVPDNYDNYNCVSSSKNINTGDTISLEYSYNTLEFSLNKEKSIFKLMEKFNTYYKYINNILAEYDYKLYDSGINPYYNFINKECLNQDRYKIIEKLLLKNQKKILYAQFCAYCCSIQTHINVDIENLVDKFNLFTLISANKNEMFSNSYMFETKLKNSRKYLWENSNFGPANVGKNKIYTNIEELKDDYLKRNLFFVERDNKFFLLKEKYSLIDYFAADKVLIIDENGCEKTVTPLESDFKNFRSYKDVELTKYGTLEIRTDCTQELDNIFKVIAFNVGISVNDKEVFKYICDNKKIDNKKLVEYAKKGLRKRGLGEESILCEVNQK